MDGDHPAWNSELCTIAVDLDQTLFLDTLRPADDNQPASRAFLPGGFDPSLACFPSSWLQNQTSREGETMMKRLCVCVSAVMCLLALCRTCTAQSNPWNGSWKLDPSSLKYEGATFSVATDADGFTVTSGGEAQPKVVCDGTEHKSTNGTTLTCTKSANGYVITASKDGKTTRKTTISISDEGKTRISNSENSPADGEPFTTTMISKRVSGGPGPAGEWKEVKFSSSQDSGVLSIAVKGDTVDFKETDTPKPVTCKLEGTETKFPGGGSMSVKLADPHRLKVTYKGDDGKVRRENTFALSEDGTTITETDVTPAPSPSTMFVVLHKM
jgi:hypothetical protein